MISSGCGLRSPPGNNAVVCCTVVFDKHGFFVRFKALQPLVLEGRRGGCTHVMHGRSRMYGHRPSHPYAGMELVGFTPTRHWGGGGRSYTCFALHSPAPPCVFMVTLNKSFNVSNIESRTYLFGVLVHRYRYRTEVGYRSNVQKYS